METSECKQVEGSWRILHANNLGPIFFLRLVQSQSCSSKPQVLSRPEASGRCEGHALPLKEYRRGRYRCPERPRKVDSFVIIEDGKIVQDKV